MTDDNRSNAHPAPDQLSAAAAGDAVPDAVTEHFATCMRCRDDVDALARLLAALAQPVALEDPPADVWDRIRGEIGGDLSDAPSEADLPSQDHPSVTTGRSHIAAPHDELKDRRRRKPRWAITAVAAAVGIVLGAGGAALVGAILGGPEDPETPEPPPVATIGEAVLDPTTKDSVQGTARMISSDADGDQLVVSVSDLPEKGYFEVWLRDEDASRLISLGTVTSTTTTLPVPQGVDLARFPIVDVSQEDFDGDPSHSGVTVAAGPMAVDDGQG